MNLLSTSSTAGGLGFTLIYIVVICAVMWFLLVRPQKKEQKRLAQRQTGRRKRAGRWCLSLWSQWFWYL